MLHRDDLARYRRQSQKLDIYRIWDLLDTWEALLPGTNHKDRHRRYGPVLVARTDRRQHRSVG